MQEIENNKTELAALVAVKTRGLSKEKAVENLDELEMLTSTAGAETVFKILQDRDRPDPAYFIGKGKAEELAELIDLNDISIVIFDDDLTATQVRNLERLIEKKIIDRSGLILDIFASHAKTNQAKTQVELAQLQYMLPRLTRAWTHLSKQYGGIGTKGPGETQIETDRRIIRTRISKLKEKLVKIEAQQKTRSLKRKNFVTAALVGYTNAGKSTLLNLLTDADVLAEDKLFATLDSTTRAYHLDVNKKILMSDTVGFIRKLPHNLIASFKSTLNVVRDADIILHIVDISNSFYEDHIHVVEETLKELKCSDKPQLKIFNKVDEIGDKETLDFAANNYTDSIFISAEKGMNITALKNKLLGFYENSYIEESLNLKIDQSKIISQIHSLAKVLHTEYNEDSITIKYRTSGVNDQIIKSIINEKKKIKN